MTEHARPPSSDAAPIPNAMAEAIAAYALDALPPEERPRVVTYLAQNPAARALLDEYRAVVDLLPYAAAHSAPPATLRADVLRALPRQSPSKRGPSTRLVWRSWLAPAIAACLILGLCVWNITLQVRLAHPAPAAVTTASFFSKGGLVSYDMRPDPTAPNAWGRIYLTQDHQQVGLAVHDLPRLPPDHSYQLWFRLSDQTRVSVTTFVPDASGAALLVLPSPPAGATTISCGITEEPRGGSAAPTGPRVLASGEWKPAGTAGQEETYSLLSVIT